MRRLSSIGYVLAAALVSGCVSDASASFRYGVGGGGGGGGAAVAESLTPSSGTPSSIADAATLDAGLFAGWKVADPYGIFNSMSDDGTTFDVAFDRGTGGTSSLNLSNAYLTQGRIFYPEQIEGDFEMTMRVDQSANAAHTATEIAIMAGAGNTTNEAHHIAHRYGDYLTATAAYKRTFAAGGGNKEENGTTAISRTAAPRWVRLQRVGQTIRYSEGGTASTPSWTDVDEEWDTGGATVDIGVAFYAGSTTEETYRIYEVTLTGTERAP